MRCRAQPTRAGDLLRRCSAASAGRAVRSGSRARHLESAWATWSRSSGASGCAAPTGSSDHLPDPVDMSLSTVVRNPVDSGSPDPRRQRLLTDRPSGRHVEKLSPGMCTGWGDPVHYRSATPSATPARTTTEGRRTPWTTASPARMARKAGAGPAEPHRPVEGRAQGMGTDRGQPGDWSWTDDGRCARRSSCPRVDTGTTPTTHSGPTGPLNA